MIINSVSTVKAIEVYNKPSVVNAKTSPKNVTPKSDSADFSPEGLAALLKRDLGMPETTGPITLEDIEAAVTRDKGYVQNRLNYTLKEHEIGKNTKFSLSSSPYGEIKVSGDFEKKDILEDALNKDNEFKNTFRRLSANSSLLEAAKKAVKFQKAYEVDPKRAVAEFAQLLSNNNRYSFRLDFYNGITETVVS